MELSPEEKKHYNRHLILNEIGLEGQLKLKKAKVLVVGAGGLGCPILQYLTAAGVGTIGIIDDDVVEVSNLQRQILYTYDDVGTSKVLAAVAHLSRLNPFVNFLTYQEKLTSKNAVELFEQFDIIVDGSDNFPTRYLCNDAAVLAKKPLVFGAIYKFEGQVSVFNYRDGPTYRCLYPNAPKPNEVLNCSEIGVLGVLPGIIGCLQANEVLKIICELGEVLRGKLLTFDALKMQQLLVHFEKTDEAKISELQSDYNFFCGIMASIAEISIQQLESNQETYNLLDVREDFERAQYHIGGQHIPLGELQERFDEINKEKNLVVYCKSGVRSKKAIEILKKLHFSKRLINLKEGCF
ncbi:MAG: HesA/MoeB/ThiF family protein [Flavobacteriaceae bacterium]|nr:HesA/MoeB/ThiF family protein [Flavobacteriaceae bacterium]